MILVAKKLKKLEKLEIIYGKDVLDEIFLKINFGIQFASIRFYEKFESFRIEEIGFG